MADEKKTGALGALSRDDLLTIYRTSVDPTYERGLDEAGEGSGLEIYEQAAAQWERVSLAIDRSFQGYFLKEHSLQTSPHAGGATYATVELTFERSSSLEHSLVLQRGTAVEEVEIDWSEEGGVENRTGRLYDLTEDVTFLPGERGPLTAVARAQRTGWGHNNPRPGTIRYVRQVGEVFENNRATVDAGNLQAMLIATNQADMFVPTHLGQYVRFIEGANRDKIARIVKYEAPDPTAPFDLGGSRVTLSREITIWVTMSVGVFEVGEIVNVAFYDASFRVLKMRHAGGTKYLVMAERLTTSAPLDLTGEIIDSEAGTVGTVSQMIEDQSLQSEAPPVGGPGGATWRIFSWKEDFGLTCTNVTSPAGGVPDMLGLIGREVDIDKAPFETDESYRTRIDEARDVVSPNAIRRAVARVMGNSPWCFREVGTAALSGIFFDANDFYDTAIVVAEGNFGGLLANFRQGTPVVLKEGNANGPIVLRGYYAGFGSPTKAYITFRGEPGQLTSSMRFEAGFLFATVSAETTPDFPRRQLATYLSHSEMRAFFLVSIPRTGINDPGPQWGFFPWDSAAYDGEPAFDHARRQLLRQSVEVVKAFGISFDVVFDETCTTSNGMPGTVLPDPAPPPMFLSISPSSGPLSGGTSFTIFGSGFVVGLTVTFDGIPATITSVTATEIEGSTPAGSLGFANIQILLPDGQTSGTQGDNAFDFESPP